MERRNPFLPQPKAFSLACHRMTDSKNTLYVKESLPMPPNTPPTTYPKMWPHPLGSEKGTIIVSSLKVSVSARGQSK